VRIVGIDPSLSRTGVCVIDAEDASVTLHSITSKSSDDIFSRQKKAVHAVRALLCAGDVTVFEDFGVSARFAPSGRFCERIEMCGMLKLIAPLVTGLPWLTLSPPLLKGFATGRTSAHKREVIQAVLRDWGVSARNDDEADAFVLARYALAVLAGESCFAKRISRFEAYSQNRQNLTTIRFSCSTVLTSLSSVVDSIRPYSTGGK